MEKLLIESNGSQLHAELYKSDLESATHESIVIICHGFTGDKYEWGRFITTAEELNKEGFDAIIFDFAGSGENKREMVLLSKQKKNLEDVGVWAINNGYTHIATIGLSFGGLTSLIADVSNRKVAIFWAAAFYFKEVMKPFEKFLAKHLPKILPNLKIKRKSSGNYPPIIIGSQFMKENFQLDPNSYLQEFSIPTLILNGKEDTSVSPDIAKKAFEMMPKGDDHQLILISDADHDFDGEQLNEFIDESLKWLKKYLK